MIINKLILQDFRAFRGYHEFDFSNKKIIVINGPNGHGKSTIFDAMNWVFLGKLNRYSGSIEGKRFNYIVNNHAKESGKYITFVQIELEENNETTVIKRELKYNSSEKIYINGVLIEYNEIHSKVADILVKSKNIAVGEDETHIDLSTLVSSTQILSQEDLDEFVRGNKPGERYKKLEKILGFKRYGEDFKSFLNDAKTIVSKDLGDLEAKKKEITSKKDILETKFNEQKKAYENSGGITEEQLLKKIYDINHKQILPDGMNYINLLRTNVIEDEILEKLKVIKKELTEKSNDLKRLENKIKSRKLSSINLAGIFQDKLLLNKQIVDFKKEIDERKQQINKAIKRVNYYRELDISLNKIRNIKIEVTQLENKYKELEDNLEILFNKEGVKELLVEMSFKEFQQQYNLKQNYLSDLRLWVEINESEESISKYKTEIIELNNLIEQYNNNLKKINIEKLEYKKNVDILNNSIENKEDSHLNQFIYDIRNYILNSEVITDCPVCGTNFELNAKSLKEQIREKLNEVKKELTVLQNKKLELVNYYNDLESRSKNISNNIEKNEHYARNIQANIDLLQNKIVNLKSKVQFHNIDKGLENNIQSIKKISDYIEKFENLYNNISIILNIEDQKNIVNDKLEFNKSERTRHLLSIPKRCLIYVNSISKLNRKEQVFKNYIESSNVKVKNVELLLNETILKLEQDSNEEVIIRNISQEYQKEFKTSSCILDIGIMLNNINEKHTDIINATKYLDDVIYSIYSYLNENEFIEIKNEKDKASLSLNKISNIIVDNKEKLEQIEEFLKGHKSIQTNILNQYLEDQSKNINFYYKQISPHAFYKNVKLVALKGELYILLLEEGQKISSLEVENLKNEVNASLTFSAAQSTILALSIFLSLNSTNNWSKLEVLGIDDPFQNLDDVNIFSFVDVISTLINKKQKQVFLSTHNNDFAKLITSKLDIKEDEIGNITFLSYSKDKMLISSNVKNNNALLN